MKEIIEAQEKWRAAKKEAERYCLSVHDDEMARKLSECTMFTGEENLPEVIDLMFSAQGREFLLTFNFPDIETFRMFKIYHPEKYGVYIDAGRISLSEPRRAFLVGDTSAEISLSDAELSRIMLMHGANASINASGYSVVSIGKDSESICETNVSGNAKVMS